MNEKGQGNGTRTHKSMLISASRPILQGKHIHTHTHKYLLVMVTMVCGSNGRGTRRARGRSIGLVSSGGGGVQHHVHLLSNCGENKLKLGLKSHRRSAKIDETMSRLSTGRKYKWSLQLHTTVSIFCEVYSDNKLTFRMYHYYWVWRNKNYPKNICKVPFALK